MASESVLELPPWTEKQAEIFKLTSNEQLLGGATRGGKSFYVRKALIRWCAEIPGLQTDIFRLHFDDVIANHMQGNTSFAMLLDQWLKDKLVTITQTEVKFWNGSLIALKHCSDDIVMQKNQGIPSHVRIWEEATQIPIHRINWLNKWVTMDEQMLSRVPEKWKGQFPKILYPTNPIGISAPYFRREFVDKGARRPFKYGNFIREYVPILVSDNPHEDQEATKRRFETDDPALAKAMLYADWHVMVGEFFPEWDETRHVVPDFSPPGHWFRFRAFDWGLSDPFCVYWIAVSDGEPFYDKKGIQRWFPRGAFVFYNEWYGADPRDPSKGIRMSNEDIAKGIIERSEYGTTNLITLTDSKPFQGTGGETIAQTFARNGVILSQADTSRVPGWAAMRSRLIGKEMDYAFNGGEIKKLPMIYFTECCFMARAYIPALPRHKSESKKDDAAEHGEATHSPDTIRYACMAHTVIRDKIEPTEDRIRRELKSKKRTFSTLIKNGNKPQLNFWDS